MLIHRATTSTCIYRVKSCVTIQRFFIFFAMYETRVNGTPCLRFAVCSGSLSWILFRSRPYFVWKTTRVSLLLLTHLLERL